ncbi:MAG TPA: GNAT family N-acetyltransferase [Blastocatellia bacterium]|nr:GNAT family N-acetyltransferase [Blastocatellia bacterium]
MTEVRVSVTENRISDPSRIPVVEWKRYLDDIGKGWVCESNGRIVGFVIACLRDASIWALFVKPDYEGRGIGKNLLGTAADWLRKNGASMVYLSTDPNTRADRFYQLQGWKRGEVRPDGEVCYSLRLQQG